MKRMSVILFSALLSLCFAVINKPQGLSIGDVAPDFSGKNQNGKEVSLKNLLKANTVVLVFYRGEWCPYCNKQLKELEDSLKFITEKGAVVVAISPEKIENLAKTVEKTNAMYDLISDKNLKIMNAYKVTYEVDAKTTEMYNKYGIDLKKKNGANGNNLPVPTVYIISKSGKVIYKHLDENFKLIVSVREILNNL